MTQLHPADPGVLRADILEALAHDNLIDITTAGRRTGRRRRIGLMLHRVNGGYFLSGRPGRRHWVANLAANPAFVIHLRYSVQADVPAVARVVQDVAERRRIMPAIARRIGFPDVLAMVAEAPLIDVTITP